MPPKTALKKYQRLEGFGLWREGLTAQRREVVVGLREATLILSDPKSNMALSQWSLPAIERLNPDEMPALFSPCPQDGEVLELTDPDMVAALDTLHNVLQGRRPRPGRLRARISLATILIAVMGTIFWLPKPFLDHSTTLLPEPTRKALGLAALADLTRFSGSPCKTVPGRRAAATLAVRLFPDNPPEIVVLRQGLAYPVTLPGNIFLMPATLVQSAQSPEVVAGYLIAENLRIHRLDPARPLLSHIGLIATIRTLATGVLGADALANYGKSISELPLPAPLPVEDLLAAFAKARIPSSPYAYSLDPTGEATLDLIEADPYANKRGDRVLGDETWLELQAICTE